MSGNPWRADRVGSAVHRSAAYASIDPEPLPLPAGTLRPHRGKDRDRSRPRPLEAGGPSWALDRATLVRRTRFAAILAISLHLVIALTVTIGVPPRPRPPVKVTRIPMNMVTLGGPAGGAGKRSVATARRPEPPPEKERTPKKPAQVKPQAPKQGGTAKPKPAVVGEGKVVPKKVEPESPAPARAESRTSEAARSRETDPSPDGLTRIRSELPLAGGGIGSMELGVSGPLTEYSYYLSVVRQKIASRWEPPPAVAGVETAATVRFRIDRDGQVSSVMIEEPSGSVPFDTAGMRAVRDAAPMPPFPQDLSEEWVMIHLRFVVAE